MPAISDGAGTAVAADTGVAVMATVPEAGGVSATRSPPPSLLPDRVPVKVPVAPADGWTWVARYAATFTAAVVVLSCAALTVNPAGGVITGTAPDATRQPANHSSTSAVPVVVTPVTGTDVEVAAPSCPDDAGVPAPASNTYPGASTRIPDMDRAVPPEHVTV